MVPHHTRHRHRRSPASPAGDRIEFLKRYAEDSGKRLEVFRQTSQQMAMPRMLGRDLHSTYGPTADTGGLLQNHAPTIYAYTNLPALLEGETRGAAKARLPGSKGDAVTERPD